MTSTGEGKELTRSVEPPKPGYHPPADAPHHLRGTDRDPRQEKRAERQVALVFSLAIVLSILFVVGFFTIPGDELWSLPVLGEVKALHLVMGVTFGLAAFLIGAGAIHWAKKLMTDVEVEQERHPIKSSAEDTAETLAVFEAGTEMSGFTKYPVIRRTLIGAMAILPLPLIFTLRDLWQTPAGNPSPASLLSTTMWKPGERIVSDITYQPVKASDIPVGGLVNAVPESLPEVEHEDENLNERGKAAIILVRMDPQEIVSQQEPGWDYQGILAFSKICTHVGCPISLYEQRTHHLLCPCHQSTFDLSDSGNVVFGPAARRMPQLPISVDDEGYLIALGDFAEPVGPSFWELGGESA